MYSSIFSRGKNFSFKLFYILVEYFRTTGMLYVRVKYCIARREKLLGFFVYTMLFVNAFGYFYAKSYFAYVPEKFWILCELWKCGEYLKNSYSISYYTPIASVSGITKYFFTIVYWIENKLLFTPENRVRRILSASRRSVKEMRKFVSNVPHNTGIYQVRHWCSTSSDWLLEISSWN